MTGERLAVLYDWRRRFPEQLVGSIWGIFTRQEGPGLQKWLSRSVAHGARPTSVFRGRRGHWTEGRGSSRAAVTMCVFAVRSLQALLPQYVYFWRITIPSLAPQTSYLSAEFFLVSSEVRCVPTPPLLSLFLF